MSNEEEEVVDPRFLAFEERAKDVLLGKRVRNIEVRSGCVNLTLDEGTTVTFYIANFEDLIFSFNDEQIELGNRPY